jgi:outer membrane receptor protein involved in Fe transport
VRSLPWRWIAAAVALKLAVNFSVADRYGWHRDELYYRDAGQHLSFGYARAYLPGGVTCRNLLGTVEWTATRR